MEWIVLLGLVLAIPVLLIVVLVKLGSLQQRVRSLEMAQAARAASASVAEPVGASPDVVASAAASTETAAPVESAPAATAPPPVPGPSLPQPDAPSLSEPDLPSGREAWEEVKAEPPAPPPPNPLERALSRAWNWLVTGNLPVKVGMLVLLAGVAALLKYASDQGWMRMPVELRLAGISAAALGGLVFAWHKRESHRVFALAVQGGAIGVLLLVVFAAVKLYGFVDPGLAFALSVLLIAGGAGLAVVQESRALAVLSVLAGFMAPIWLGGGSGNYIALFSWYALLNAGIFAIAWVRPWRSLNLIGFAFTWGIGLVWGVLDYTPDKYAASQAFLALFFAFYLLLPLLYARKEMSKGSARVDAALLFGTPLVAFSLQVGLLEGEQLPLALCALGVAALYALLGWKLMGGRERLHRLAQGYAILAVGFATLAVPLALSANTTATVFALEGAGLVWLGFAQKQRLARWSGLGLQLAAAVAWVVAEPIYSYDPSYTVIANAACMGGLLIALAGFAIAWLYRRGGNTRLALGAYLWGLVWWVAIFWREIFEYTSGYGARNWVYEVWQPFMQSGFLLLFGLTAWLAAEAHRRQPGKALAWTTCGSLMLALVAALAQYWDAPFAYCSRLFSLVSVPMQGLDCSVYPGPTGGSWVWLLFALMGARSLYALRVDAGRAARLAQLTWWLLWTAVLSLEVWWNHYSLRLPDDWLDSMTWFLRGERQLAPGWVHALMVVPWLALLALSLRRWSWLRWPLGAAFDRTRPALHITVLAVVAFWWLLNLLNAGNSAPLPWLVVFNPLDLAQMAALLLAGVWWQQQPWLKGREAGIGWALLALAGLVLVSVMTLRAVHHWGGESWLVLDTSMAQTSLTVVWSILGVTGWIVGSRRGHWGLWLGSALLMLVVLVKLLLIDRGNLGNLLGIGAFIAYGLLCSLVGWLAPAPPRRALHSDSDSDSEQGTSA